MVAAVRKSASEVPLRFIDALRFASDIVRSQPRTASLLSGNSVLRAVFIRWREADSAAASTGRKLRAILGGCEEIPPRSSPQRVPGTLVAADGLNFLSRQI